MKYMVFTDSDLDGVTSYLVFKWFHEGGCIIDYCNTTITKFREDYTKWLSKNSIEDYDKIFVLDLDTHEHKDLIDTKKHFIIDHHKTHADNCNYENAKTVVKIYSSACKLTYKVFKTLYNKEITEQQKKLILVADDYDSYTHALPQSKMMNILYWNMQNRFESYLKTFYNGFVGFNFHQSNIIKQHQQELKDTINNLTFFCADVPIQQQQSKIISAFATKYINDVADHILDNLNADIAIVVNMNTKHVSFRKSKKSNVNLIDMIQKVSGEGGGHEYAAGSPLTEKFLDFTKILTPYG